MTGGRARDPFSRRIDRLSSSAASTQWNATARSRNETDSPGAFGALFEIGGVSMTEIRERRTDEEPMGIVISRGSRAESTPRFAAYVWCQVGDTTPASEPRAA